MYRMAAAGKSHVAHTAVGYFLLFRLLRLKGIKGRDRYVGRGAINILHGTSVCKPSHGFYLPQPSSSFEALPPRLFITALPPGRSKYLTIS